ncbi:YfhO family protein [Solirubrobacter ginsenosidimutans]|uniref:YfhO family protein n=1 Tax=Solirubrobacter ginsenosidimutans TaxID=490573 RepID=A0A9X3MZW4_9ACTN|nr:YfhO family protein [Solirubrobacter ginsenosidimutans]MDA0164741.1 YfhO family protein [Solirubrobacter ginsenosidimutans]
MAVFACLALGLFGSALVGGRVLTGSDSVLFDPPFSDARPQSLLRPSNGLTYDAVQVFEPDLLQARRSIRSGRLPTWSESIGAGQPMLATQQTAPLFPLQWLAFVLDFWTSLGWIAALKLVLAAAGMAMLCRALGRSAVAAALGGTVFGFSTYLIAWVAHPHSNIFALLPWAFLFTLHTVRGRPAGPIGLAATAGLMLLGGHPGTALLAGLGTAAWAVFLLAAGLRAHELTSREALVRAALLLAAGVGGLAIGAVMVLPLLELGQQGYELGRGGPPLPVKSLTSLVAPEWWGRPDAAGLPSEPANFYERTAYFGVVPAMLALAGLAVRRPARDQVFALALFVVTILIAIESPLASAVRHVPGIDDLELRRTLVFLPLAVAILAAHGLDALAERATLRRTLTVCAVVAAAPLVLFVAFHPAGHIWRTTLSRFPAFAVPETTVVAKAQAIEVGALLRWPVIGLAFVAGAVTLHRFASARVAFAAVACLGLLLTGLDLVGMGRGLQPAVPRSVVEVDPAAVQWLHRLPAGQRATADETIAPNLANRFEFRDMRVHALPLIERRSRLLNALSGTPFFQVTEWISDGPWLDRAPDVFSVSTVHSTRLENLDHPLRRSGAFEPVPNAPEGIFANQRYLPRAWVAHSWRPAQGMDSALTATVASSIDQLQDAPIIEGSPAPRAETGTPEPPDPARFVSSSDTEVVLSTNATDGGYLILNDTYYPGWRAEVDGHRVPILAANTAFRAIALPPGPHKVRFSYHPASVRYGGWITLAGLLALLVAAILVRRRSQGDDLGFRAMRGHTGVRN